MKFKFAVLGSLGLLLLALVVMTPCVAVAAPPSKDQEVKDFADESLAFLRKPWKGDLDGILKRRYLRALVVYSKTLYFLDGPTQRGMSYEALKAFEKILSKKVKGKHLKAHIIFVPVARDELIPSLAAGKGDLAVANLTITPERKKLVDFSNPFGKDVKELVVTSPKAPKIKTLAGLSGKEVYVRRSSSYYESLTRLNRKFKKQGKPPIIIKPAHENLETEDILEMVNASLMDITVVDEHLANFWKSIFKKIKVHQNLAVHTGGKIAWAMRKNCPQLKKLVNQFAKKHRVGTLKGNIVLKRYLQKNKWARNSLHPKARKRFAQTVDLFRKYSNKYHFDYLMITALAYQESRLNQSLVSPRGAVGVMQILPSTAAGNPVNIPDIKKLDKNIHAGTKYLRYIYNRYYKKAKMDEVEKVLFTFASYNAGPARVAGLRKRAKRMGLNPNRWFRNVEVAAAREIGRETVQYVANIFKYYLAYKQIVEQMEKTDKIKKQKGLKPSKS